MTLLHLLSIEKHRAVALSGYSHGLDFQIFIPVHCVAIPRWQVRNPDALQPERQLRAAGGARARGGATPGIGGNVQAECPFFPRNYDQNELFRLLQR